MDTARSSPPDPSGLRVPASELPLDPASPERTLTLRDDRFDFASFGDAVRSCRARGARLRLIDEGRLAVRELEWLGEAGADIYTSDRAKRDAGSLVLIRKAGRKGRARMAYFQQGAPAGAGGPQASSLEDLREMIGSGIDLHVSNRTAPSDPAVLAGLAGDGSKSGAVLVHYHHGPLVPGLEILTRQGAWIHVSMDMVKTDDDVRFFCDRVREARRAGMNFILHVESRPDPSRLADLAASGTAIFFKTPPSDYRSPLRPFEEQARTRKLDPRSYYLFPDHLL